MNVEDWIKTKTAVGYHPRLHGKLFKYTAQGSPFYCFTTCTNVPVSTLQDWYRLRWTVECYFKIMKTDLCLRGIRCRSSKMVLHYLGVRVLLYSMAALAHPPPPPHWLVKQQQAAQGKPVVVQGAARRRHLGILRAALMLLPQVRC